MENIQQSDVVTIEQVIKLFPTSDDSEYLFADI